jgi:hypothetical protein
MMLGSATSFGTHSKTLARMLGSCTPQGSRTAISMPKRRQAGLPVTNLYISRRCMETQREIARVKPSYAAVRTEGRPPVWNLDVHCYPPLGKNCRALRPRRGFVTCGAPAREMPGRWHRRSGTLQRAQKILLAKIAIWQGETSAKQFPIKGHQRARHHRSCVV